MVYSIMADRDGGRREPWDDTAQQYGVRRQTADPATIQAKHGSRRGHSRTQQIHYRDYQDRDVCLDAGSSGETGSRALGLFGLIGAKVGGVSSKKKAF